MPDRNSEHQDIGTNKKRKPLFQELSEFFIWCNRCVTELNYKRDKKPNVYAYDYFKVKFGIEGSGKVTYYSGILNIEVYDDGNPVFYDINEIKEKSQDIGVTELTGSKSSLPNSSAKSSDGIQYSIGGNSGYVGYSMSVRASNAYDDGRKPISKFTREDLDSFNAMLEENGIDARVNSVKAFKDILVSYDRSGEWHHTSKYGNRTKFYDPERALDSILELDSPEEAIRIANTIGTEAYRKQESEKIFREEHEGRSFEEELAYEKEEGAKRDREILSRTTSPLGRRYAQAVVDWRDGKKEDV